MKTELSWQQGMKYLARGQSGQYLTMDTSKDEEGNIKGHSPMELVLHGTAGCSAIDIVLILEKMKVEIEDFRVEVRAERAEDHPRKFTEINLNYFLKGKGLTDRNVQRAIDLSLDKYCSAVNSLSASINYSYKIKNRE